METLSSHQAKSQGNWVWSLRSLLPVWKNTEKHRHQRSLIWNVCVFSNDSLSFFFFFLMQNSAWKKHKSCGTSLLPMTPKKPQQWLQVVGHAGVFSRSHLSCIFLLSWSNFGKKLNKQLNIQQLFFSLLASQGAFVLGIMVHCWRGFVRGRDNATSGWWRILWGLLFQSTTVWCS